MDRGLELKDRPETVMEATGDEENVDFRKEPEVKHVSLASTFESKSFEVEASMDERTKADDKSLDVDVNIIEHMDSDDVSLVKVECQDTTESSSSFGDTFAEGENGATFGDEEVQSELNREAISALTFNGHDEVFHSRKKKLTAHWRTFIRPLMWRCKWAELQIHKFQSQAIEYDKELAEYSRRKQSVSENIISEDCGAKSFPFTHEHKRKEIMKRRKRKRVEDTVDIASYVSHHNLFSYYENKKSAADAACLDDGWGNEVISTDKTRMGMDELGIDDEMLPIEIRNSDNSLEQIVRKIGTVQAQVSKMKSRIQKLMNENAAIFECTDKLSLLVPCNGFTSSAQNPASPHNDGDTVQDGISHFAAHNVSDSNMDDLFMPESAASSHGEVSNISDMIESTNQPRVGSSCPNVQKGILVYNRRAKDQPNNLKEVNRPVGKLQTLKDEQGSSVLPFPHIEPDLPTDDQPTLKIRSISKLTAPNNKRKRSRRKSVSGRLKRRSS